MTTESKVTLFCAVYIIIIHQLRGYSFIGQRCLKCDMTLIRYNRLHFVVFARSLFLTCVSAIINGQLLSSSAKSRLFPFAISIAKDNEAHCSGVLLSGIWTLTTCKCLGTFVEDDLIYYNLSTLVLLSGSRRNVVTLDNYDQVQLRVPIEALHHPLCRKSEWNWRADYGAYKTEAFSLGRHVKPVVFMRETPLKGLILLWVGVEAMCVTVGWGATVINYPMDYQMASEYLRMAQVNLMDWVECEEALCQPPLSDCSVLVYGSGKICAKSVNGSDSCDKDEGGALICGEQTLVGITSGGLDCGEFEKPRLYSSMESGYKWIQSLRYQTT